MITNILFFTICGIIITYIILLIFEKARIKKGADYDSPENGDPDNEIDSTAGLVVSVLKKINCIYNIKVNDEETTTIDFSFQGGNFSIDCAPKSSYIKIFYLFLYETQVKNLALIRHLCNHLNINSRIPKFIYSIDEAQNKIYVHIYSCALFVGEIHDIKSYFENLLIVNFELQRVFTYQFKELEKESGKENEDIEESNANWRRQLFLLREQEIMHQATEFESRYNEVRNITVGQFIKTIYNNKNLQPVSMKVITDGELKIIDIQEDILNFDILDAVLEKEGESKPEIRFEMMTLIITCNHSQTALKKTRRLITINLTTEGETETSFYFRLTSCITPVNISKVVSKSKPNNTASAHSMIIAYDFVSPKQKLAEFNYMNNDALWKIKNKKISELSEEQQLIAMCSNATPSYNLYWGKKLYLEKRYYEALLHLENGYYEMLRFYNKMSKSQKGIFYELCYLIGYCYCELKDYQRAYYFLDSLPQLNNIIYTQEYINCLVNSQDFRALPVIDNLLTYIAKDGDPETDDEEANKSLSSFINFLRRRKAYVYIDIGELEEAEKIYTQMLAEPENSDYALNELAYIQKLKKESDNI